MKNKAKVLLVVKCDVITLNRLGGNQRKNCLAITRLSVRIIFPLSILHHAFASLQHDSKARNISRKKLLFMASS